MQLLELQRASAGSGKTYQLAKKYIWLFITIESDDKPRRLRTLPELADSLSHILAVTFTNKATNEMQERIVKKLNALASYTPGGEMPDYMEDFCSRLGIGPEQVSRTCRQALMILLENYSDFKVSTIDSFFQLVLRTFAYESDLNDSYSIELDSEFLARVGIDATFDDIDRRSAPEDVRMWVDMLMKRNRSNGSRWNIFQKNETKGDPYLNFLNSLKKLGNEDFKEIRDELEQYFEQTPEFAEIYERMEKECKAILKAGHDKMTELAEALLAIPNMMEQEPSSKKFVSDAKACLDSPVYNLPQKASEGNFTAKTADDFGKPTHLKRHRENPAYYSAAEPAYLDMVEARDQWLALFDSPTVKHWHIYRKNFPYLGLISVSLRKRREYLRENNSVELSETNALLSKIIGEDDAPFVYERLGTILNHFLIDEFQDTSRMQWKNLYPLLAESLSRGNENLLIGDAKQSIYRFRNADPSLISDKVEKQFGCVRTLGDTPEENCNRRSDRNIVEFNNGFFSLLTDKLDQAAKEGAAIRFRNLYHNVCQLPNQKEKKGYIEVNFIEGSKAEASEKIIATIPGVIEELLERNYKMGEIAVLVDTNGQGEAIIHELTRHNSLPGVRKIEFVSEQSLKVAGSAAVQQILSVMKAIGRGVHPQVRRGEEGKRKGVADWNEVGCNFRMFSLRHPELSGAEQLDEFLKSGNNSDAIAGMLGEMQTVSLPALTEGIAAEFLPQELRRTDAPFIAAFQDLVLEYCESRPSDICSFLQWWDKRGKNASITSPEGTDAVNIMTIHKSKGLEFACVIIPFAELEFHSAPSGKPEWRWVRPIFDKAGDIKMPPYVPVDTDSALCNSEHEEKFNEFVEMVTMDNLNKLYVGMTRARNELYIYCNGVTKSKGISTSTVLREFMGDDGTEPMLAKGEKYTDANSELKRADTPQAFTLDDYYAHISPKFLRYKEEMSSEQTEAEKYDSAADSDDPRSEGNLMHSVMENVRVSADVPGAIRRLRRQGLVSAEKAAEMEKFISDRILGDEAVRWFDGQMRCINERAVIGAGGKTLRPDRVMETSDGGAIVVDYKFGEVAATRKYQRQVRDYVERLKDTGRYRYVKGYLWYMRENKIEHIC